MVNPTDPPEVSSPIEELASHTETVHIDPDEFPEEEDPLYDPLDDLMETNDPPDEDEIQMEEASTYIPPGLLDRLRTQKARGIVSLCITTGFIGFTKRPGLWVDRPLIGTRWGKDSRISIFPHNALFLPAFARPCPTSPRHGFVDSIMVDTVEQAQTLIQRTLAEDPDGEVVFMQRLFSGAYSAVVTNAGVTWGRGNDGATSGASGCVHIPVACPLIKWRSHISSTCAYGNGLEEVRIEDTPYLELVEDDGALRVVQLRDGPAQILASDFIPEPMIVKHVLSPTILIDRVEALLKWEKLIKFVQPGTVVWLQDGSLSSHYAVHAISAGIPVVTSHVAPVVDATLVPASTGPKPFKVEDYEYLADVIASELWSRVPLSTDGREVILDGEQIVAAALAALHTSALWPPEEKLISIMGWSIAMMWRFTTMACLGEARHFYSSGPGHAWHVESPWNMSRKARKALSGDNKRPGLVAWNRLMPWRTVSAMWTDDPDVEKNGPARESVYTTIINLPFANLFKYLKDASVDLAQPGWNGSFGGKSWTNAAVQNISLGNSICRFASAPSQQNYADLIQAWNRVGNAVHNGGPVLNKWLPQGKMNQIVNCPQLGFMSPIVAQLALNLPGSPYRSRPAYGEREGLTKTAT